MSPKDFWEMSFCEFFAARDAKFPPEKINNNNGWAKGFKPFTVEEEQLFAEMRNKDSGR